MDCRVVVEAAVPVYDVETADEAIRIAIAKTGKMLNPDLSYVDIEMGTRTSPGGEELPPAFVAADEALVALELAMTVFNVDGTEHASRIARAEIGKRLEGVPLKVVDHGRVADDDGEQPPDDDGESTTEDADADPGEENGDEADGDATDATDDRDAVPSGDDGPTDSTDDGPTDSTDDGPTESTDDGTSEDLLPEFEEMVEENRR